MQCKELKGGQEKSKSLEKEIKELRVTHLEHEARLRNWQPCPHGISIIF